MTVPGRKKADVFLHTFVTSIEQLNYFKTKILEKIESTGYFVKNPHLKAQPKYLPTLRFLKLGGGSFYLSQFFFHSKFFHKENFHLFGRLGGRSQNREIPDQIRRAGTYNNGF